MNEPLDPPNFKPDKTWLSSVLLALGVLAVVVAVFGFLSGGSGFAIGFGGLAVAAILFALSRALDYLHEIVQRLRRSDRKSDEI